MARKKGNEMVKVRGHCPQGCGETLFLGSGNHVTCSWVECPAPASVDQLLEDPDIGTHIVTYDEGGAFAIQHPIAERLSLGAELFLCPLHSYLRASPAMPAGRYRATTGDEVRAWNLEAAK